MQYNISSSKHNSFTIFSAPRYATVRFDQENKQELARHWTCQVERTVQSFECAQNHEQHLSVSRNALISSWNKARRLEPYKNPSDVDEDVDGFIELELLELGEPDEQSIEVSGDENDPIPPKKINKNLNQTSITRFLSKVIY